MILKIVFLFLLIQNQMLRFPFLQIIKKKLRILSIYKLILIQFFIKNLL